MNRVAPVACPRRSKTKEAFVFRTKRFRLRALLISGMATVAVGLGVTSEASAAEVSAPTSVATDQSLPYLNPAIAPPAGSRPLGAYAVQRGTQTYTCTNGVYGGASVPEAQLIGTGGIVHHFAGPSWQSLSDGSLVTAVSVAVAPSPIPNSIPQLLLRVNSHTGEGVLSKADYINRLLTEGGTAPTGPCTNGAEVSAPYSAVYVFWAS